MNVTTEPLKSKLVYYRNVYDAICSLELLEELHDGHIFDQHLAIRFADDAIQDLAERIEELREIEVAYDHSWNAWPYPEGHDVFMLQHEEDDDHTQQVIDLRTDMVNTRVEELEDDIAVHVEHRDNAERELGLISIDAAEAVRFLLCGGSFERSFN